MKTRITEVEPSFGAVCQDGRLLFKEIVSSTIEMYLETWPVPLTLGGITALLSIVAGYHHYGILSFCLIAFLVYVVFSFVSVVCLAIAAPHLIEDAEPTKDFFMGVVYFLIINLPIYLLAHAVYFPVLYFV